MTSENKWISKLYRLYTHYTNLGGVVDREFNTSDFYNYPAEQLSFEVENITAVIRAMEKARALGLGLGFDFYIKQGYYNKQSRNRKITYLGSIIEIDTGYNDNSIIKVPNDWYNISLIESLRNIITFSWTPEIELHLKSKDQLVIQNNIINTAIATGNLKLYINGTKVRQL